MRRTSPWTRIIGGRPADRCRSEALFLTENASSSVMSMDLLGCGAVGRGAGACRRALLGAMTTMIADNLAQRARAHCKRLRGAPDAPVQSVTLLAVSKTFGADAVREAHAAGQRALRRELRAGGASPRSPRSPTCAAHRMAPDRPAAEQQDARRRRRTSTGCNGRPAEDRRAAVASSGPPALPPLQVCLQVNISGEASKSGVAPGEVAGARARGRALPRLRLRGLMAIPEPAGGLRGAAARRIARCASCSTRCAPRASRSTRCRWA